MASTSPTAVNNPFPRPTPPSPDYHPTVIVVVFISFGCILLFGAVLFCIWWLIKKHHKCKHCHERKNIHERKDVDVDEHLRVQEMIVRGPHGPKKVLVQVDDDVRVHKDTHKEEIDMVGKALYGERREGSAGASGSNQNLTLPERQV
ncbi:uncharacterized protein LOC110725443 [Chenopodium quinoa]|uniref:Uncharacterized protein n=1 Tax=Chenopodium quinoa TaxID=63459 RepID=A0A803LHP3_CHEQI|nr:uncharacterized protein LOC110725443 [Chenopodium quinoa]